MNYVDMVRMIDLSCIRCKDLRTLIISCKSFVNPFCKLNGSSAIPKQFFQRFWKKNRLFLLFFVPIQPCWFENETFLVPSHRKFQISYEFGCFMPMLTNRENLLAKCKFANYWLRWECLCVLKNLSCFRPGDRKQ